MYPTLPRIKTPRNKLTPHTRFHGINSVLPHSLPASPSRSILKLQSETILEKLKQKWWQKNAQACSQEDEKEGLSFQTLGGVFLLAGIGVAAGLLLCLLETAWARISTKRRKVRVLRSA